jgi:1,4-alpha-glucan branching enzyme
MSEMTDSTMCAHAMPFGAEFQSDGAVRFRLWAPTQARVSLVLEGQDSTLPMTRLEDGWHEVVTNQATSGTRYRFELEDGSRVPDPASRHQPEDVHGPSEVSILTPTNGATAGGAAAAGRNRSSTSSTSGRSRPKARSARPSTSWTTSSTSASLRSS